MRSGLANVPPNRHKPTLVAKLGKNLTQVATPTLGSTPARNLSANAVRHPPLAINTDAWRSRSLVNVWSGRPSETAVTPHVMRHSCTVALLQAGVDVSVIRDYLGHASVATTSRYITTNLQMKHDVLEAFWKRAVLSAAPLKKLRPSSKLLRSLKTYNALSGVLPVVLPHFMSACLHD